MAITLLDYQCEARDLALTRDFIALFMDMGTGKTFIALSILEAWATRGKRRMLVIVPNTLCGNWLSEAEKFGLTLPIMTLPKGADRRKKVIASDAWQVLVLGYDATRNLVEDIIAARPDGLILDEMQKVKSRTSGQSKACWAIAQAVKQNSGSRIGMSGTPVAKDPLDLWSEFNILDPSKSIVGGKDHPLGYGKYRDFEAAVCIMHVHPRMPMVKKPTFPPERLEALRKRVAPHVFERTIEQCVTLPEKTFSEIVIDPHPEQARMYTALKEDFVASLANGNETAVVTDMVQILNKARSGIESVANEEALEEFEIAQSSALDTGDDRRVTTLMAATTLIRLHQIASGFVKTDDGETRDLPNPKIDVLRDCLPQWTDKLGNHKVIIFCRFIHDISVLQKLCDELKIGYVSLSGVNSTESRAVCDAFQTNDDVRVFIGNIAVASEGLTLTAANYVCFYNNSFSHVQRSQALKRAHRIGQTRHVNYYDLIIKNTVDERVLKNLSEKRNLANATTRNLHDIMELM